MNGLEMKKEGLKRMVSLFLTAVLGAVVLLAVAGCASSKGQAAGTAPAAPAGPTAIAGEDNTEINADKSTIRDWKGRSAKAPAIPSWVQSLALDNYEQAALDLGQQSSANAGAPIYRGLTYVGPDLRGAEMRADMNFARTIAKELQTQINTYAAASSTALPDGTPELIKNLTQTKSEVTVSGARIVADFWQTVSTVDGLTKKTRTETVLYRLYRFEANDWASITAGYVQKVRDQLPPTNRLNEREVNDMLQNMLNNTRAHEALTLAEKQRQLAAQEKILDAELKAKPEEQRQAGQQALAQIYADRDVALADREVQKTQVTAESAERQAYATGDPVLTAAASTTAADADLVRAARIAARILF